MNKINFKNISKIGLESSTYAEHLAGLRANEARYFWNKYKNDFYTVPLEGNENILEWVETILSEKELTFPYKVLELANFECDGTKFVYVFYENGLVVNVMYGLVEGSKRAVGFKLSEGMDIPEAFDGKFKFAKQKSKLAGMIRGSYFVIKGSY